MCKVFHRCVSIATLLIGASGRFRHWSLEGNIEGRTTRIEVLLRGAVAHAGNFGNAPPQEQVESSGHHFSHGALLSVTRVGLSVVGNAFPALLVKDSVSQELLGGPGRRPATEVLVKPLEVSCIVKGHLVPARPVAGI
jgi:hypothetical protein